MLTALFYTCFLLRLQFRFVIPLADTFTAAFQITLIAIGESYYDIIMFMFPILVCAAGGFIVSGAFEKQMRLNYILKYALEKEQEHMDHFLNNLLPQFVVDVLNNKNSAGIKANEPNFAGHLSSRFAMKFVSSRHSVRCFCFSSCTCCMQSS